ncbi:MAG TPA: hypothetical protein EYP08_05315 [Pyrodictiaceae archaeon]|nr:hypothetical protein [Pyrodictiaceae archaeon]HIQ10647.1 hypothetical protein [Pyrodictium sp.]HIQ55462.1 hypothetical protein [Pyrodictium sp.]
MCAGENYLIPLTATTSVIDYYWYPFAIDFETFIKLRYGVENFTLFLETRKDILEHAVERIKDALKYGKVRSEPQVVELAVCGYHAARLLIAVLGDRWLASRYALAEAERSYERLQNEAPKTIEALAKILGVNLTYLVEPYREPIAIVNNVTIYRQYEYRIHFLEYVRIAQRLIGDPTWRPTNLPVRQGYVYLTKKQTTRLLKEAITTYIERSITSFHIELTSLPPVVKDYSETVRSLLSKYRKPKAIKTSNGKYFVKLPEGVILVEAFPPCMKDMYDALLRGENLSHHQRFAIATFMLNIGATIDQVVDLFKNVPDFNEKTTRYQVEHLAGLRGSQKRYLTYSCEKMRTLGLCRGDCGVRNPIVAYYKNASKLIKQSKKEEASS